MSGFSGGSQPRYQSLDFWRGVACLMIVAFHACMYPLETPRPEQPTNGESFAFFLLERAWYGVPIFFVISGFCITAACQSLRHTPRPARQYFYRRFRRIFPPFWAAMLFTLAVVSAALLAGESRLFTEDVVPLRHPAGFSPLTWITNLTLTEGMAHRLAQPGNDGAGTFLLPPAWTLGYEEQFYAVCGAALLLAGRHFFAMLAAISGAVGCVYLAAALGRPLPVTGFFFDGRWLMFAAGILVYYRINHLAARQRWRVDVALLLSVLLATGLLNVYRSHITLELRVSLLFALLIGLLHRWDIPIARSKLLRPVSLCGTMCYSLYLVHWPIVKVIAYLFHKNGFTTMGETVVTTLPVGLAMSLLAGALFHVTVERRFLNPHRRAVELTAQGATASAVVPQRAAESAV